MSAKLPISRIGFRQWVIVLGTFALLIAYQTYVGFLQTRALVSDSDQYNLGIMVLKQSHPELFVRDYVFKDTTLFQFYTPWFRTTMKWLMGLVGSFEVALAWSIPVVMLIYLPGMFALVYSITRNVWVALFVSIASSRTYLSIGGTIWGITGLTVIMPRTFFLALAPWLFLLLFRWLDNSRWWQLPLVALLGGLTAHLHPVSGMIFTELLLSMILLTQGLNRKALTNLLLSALAALVGASSVLVNYLGRIDTDTASAPFAVFYRVMHERIGTLFPLDPSVFSFFGHQLSLAEQEVAVWMYLLGLLLFSILFLLHRCWRPTWLSERRLLGCFFACQMPMAYLLTRFSATVLIMVATAYWVLRLSESQPDRIDRWSLYLMALVCCSSFVASYFLDIIWKRFELWQFTTWIAEQPRASRFIYLPLFLYAARFMHLAVERLPSNVGILFAASVACLIKLAPGSLMWGLLAGLLLLTWCYGQRWIEASKWLELGFNVTMWTLVIRMIFLILMTPTQGEGWLALGLAAGCNLFLFCYRHHRYRWQTAVGAGLALLIFTGGLRVLDSRPRLLLSAWRSDFASAPSRLWTKVSHQSQIPARRRAAFELYDWARTHTRVDSLFYYDSLEFRFWARRSITHCYKDLGIAYYHGARIVEFHERYWKLQKAYEDSARLLSYAREYQADYVITTQAQGIQLDLPVAFENSAYVVYKLGPGDGG